MFNSNKNKGFQITFSNGYTVSVQFGEGNYCENRYKENDSINTSCENAEIMVWDKDGKTYMEPQGWQTPDEVANIIQIVANL